MASAASTARAGFHSRTIPYTPMIGATIAGRATACAGTRRQNGSSTPPSIAAAMPRGIIPISRPKGPISPVRKISAPASRNAPTAPAMECPVEAAISAAPGVDQASTTGMRWVYDKNADPTALAMQTAKTQDAVCAGVAPTAAAAASTRAMVDP